MTLAVVIVTHGGLARELLHAAETISGCRLENFVALSLPWTAGTDEAKRLIAACVSEHRAGGRQVLILSDMYGDTPSNAALTCGLPEEVALVTGVNLPMVVRLGCLGGPPRPLDELARWVQIKGRRSIRRAGAVADDAPRRRAGT